MKTLQTEPCCTTGRTKQPLRSDTRAMIRWSLGLAALVLWWPVYRQLSSWSSIATYNWMGIAQDSALGHAVQFFLYDTPKVMMLLVLVVFGVGIIRSFFTPERTRDFLSGKSALAGNTLAALLGVVTPFCSCSAVPLFVGFVTAGVPLGVTFSFLIAAPMVNEIALALLYGLLGWRIAAIYLVTGLSIAIGAGWIIGRLNLEKYLQDWVAAMVGSAPPAETETLSWPERIGYGWDAVKTIVGRVWHYVLIGIAAGAAIHGFVPQGVMAAIMGEGVWWSVPLAVVMGIPMYSNAAGIIPVVEALIGKGAALGTVLAFMMSVIALSLPEMIILRQVLKVRLIVVFAGVVGCGILVVGYLFNIII